MNAANGPRNGFAAYDGEDASETSFSSASKRAPKKELQAVCPIPTQP